MGKRSPRPSRMRSPSRWSNSVSLPRSCASVSRRCWICSVSRRCDTVPCPRSRAVSDSGSRSRQRWHLHPALLVLDEPTSQLDPWGADDVMTALERLNADLSVTIVIAEHRLDRLLPANGHADLDGGRRDWRARRP